MTLLELEQACQLYRAHKYPPGSLICARVDTTAGPTVHGGHPLITLQAYSTPTTYAASVNAAAAAALCECGHDNGEHDTGGCITCDAAWIQAGTARCPTRTPPPAGGHDGRGQPAGRRRSEPAESVGG